MKYNCNEIMGFQKFFYDGFFHNSGRGSQSNLLQTVLGMGDKSQIFISVIFV